MMRVTRFALAAFSAVVFMDSKPVLAQSWPTHTVKIITPFPPGSGGDITLRPFAEKLARHWRKPVIVENRPGADGIIAVMAVLNSSDGHTLLYTNGGPLTSNQALARWFSSLRSARSLADIGGGGSLCRDRSPNLTLNQLIV